MTLSVIGAGLPRTGTSSLKLALEQLGFGPCYHMSEIILASGTSALLGGRRRRQAGRLGRGVRRLPLND